MDFNKSFDIRSEISNIRNIHYIFTVNRLIEIRNLIYWVHLVWDLTYDFWYL